MATELKAAAVEYLATAKIGEKGQLTLPKQYREELGLTGGAPFIVLRMGDGLILLPEQRRFEQLCKKVTTALTRAGANCEDLLAALPNARKRVFARHYGGLVAKAPARPPSGNQAGQ